LPTTRHRCNLNLWDLAQSLGYGHRSLVTPERVLSEYNENLIWFFWIWSRICNKCNLYSKVNRERSIQYCL